MKTVVLVMMIMMMCICRGSISEEKNLVLGGRRAKDCRSPKGKHGSVRFGSGCIKNTCSNGKWKPNMRTDICCYKQQVHKPNTVLDTIVSADNCSSTTIQCGAVGQLQFKQSCKSCALPATKLQVEELEMNLEHQVQTVENNVQEKLEEQTEKIEELVYQLDTLMQIVNDNYELLQKLTEEKMATDIPNVPATTTTTAAPTGTTPIVEGVLITGGAGAETSTELFLPHTGKTCSLQSLPEKRYYHSLDILGEKAIVCGGYYTRTSCIQFLPDSSTGSWVNYTTLAQGRYAHTSHVYRDTMVLLGGSSPQTSEIIGNSKQFNLQQETISACSIPYDGPFTILTGGWNSDSGYLKTVALYFMNRNFVQHVPEKAGINLPDLAQGRHGHGCGIYLNKLNTQVMVVAGGEGSDGYLSSTELLPSGASSWISGESLPRTLGFAASVNMDYSSNYFLIIGGYSGTSRGEILMFNGTWTEVGMMKTGRSASAANRIMIGITEC